MHIIKATRTAHQTASLDAVAHVTCAGGSCRRWHPITTGINHSTLLASRQCFLRLQRGHRRLHGSRAQAAEKSHEYQQALYGNGYTRGCMLRARMLHLFLCRRVGEAACQSCHLTAE